MPVSMSFWHNNSVTVSMTCHLCHVRWHKVLSVSVTVRVMQLQFIFWLLGR